MAVGTVYLVGAGPSDAGLLTIRARQLLEQADVIVYDRLVGQSILLGLPERAQLIDVGKRAGNHTMPQEQINQVLLEQAQLGKTVVRLKGGDPFVFGRGGEELELLAEHNIPFEIVPGVTSAVAVPAYNGIPVTHRDAASSVHIITGHKRKNQPLELDYDALVRLNGTLVFLMSVSTMPEICKGLIQAGMRSDMPAALLQQGTTANQKAAVATVSTLEEEVHRLGLEPPAIFVVGQVCAYAKAFAWAEKRPLFGARIAVTRPKARASSLTGKLRALGAEVWEIPTIRTVPITPNPALDEALDDLKKYDWLVFTSPTGVQCFCRAMAQRKLDIRAFGNGTIASIGSGTTKELLRHGLVADVQPEVYDSVHLGQLIGELCRDEQRILIPRAKQGSAQLIAEIQKRKSVEIADLPLYDTVPIEPGISNFPQDKITMVLFTSASTVHGFRDAFPKLEYQHITAVCIGCQTQAAASELGMKTYSAPQATLDALVETAVRVYHNEMEETENGTDL